MDNIYVLKLRWSFVKILLIWDICNLKQHYFIYVCILLCSLCAPPNLPNPLLFLPHPTTLSDNNRWPLMTPAVCLHRTSSLSITAGKGVGGAGGILACTTLVGLYVHVVVCKCNAVCRYVGRACVRLSAQHTCCHTTRYPYHCCDFEREHSKLTSDVCKGNTTPIIAHLSCAA